MKTGRRRWFQIALGSSAVGVLGLASPSGANALAGLTFEMYKDNGGDFRWRLKAANGQIIGTSGQGYKAKADCKHAIEVIQKGAADAKVDDHTAKA
jgi:uncharacterized protein YegP (UPF0339 family)